MPQVIATDLDTKLSEKRWPKEVNLYQPLRTEQVLASDWANCVAVQTFLNMCNLKYKIVDKENAEHMSPNGKVPFVAFGDCVMSGLNSIVAMVANKGVTLTEGLSTVEMADMTSFMSLVYNVLGNAELYIGWLDPITYENITVKRYGFVYPWPLNKILTLQKKRAVTKRLKVLDWKQKSLEEVYVEVDQCCRALSERLGRQRFFFGDSPTELDALVFGHLFTMATTVLPDERLAKIVSTYENLKEFCQYIDKNYFEMSTPSIASSISSNGNGDYDRLEDAADME